MLDQHARTLRRSVAVAAGVRDDQWDAPTPCAEWSVRELVAHMIRENRGFAAAAAGERADRSAWSSAIGPDPRADYAKSADRVVRAFAAPGALDRDWWLPQIHEAVLFPGAKALGFHLLDYLVHGWDLAVATGQHLETDGDAVAAVDAIARRDVPDGPRRRREGATFAPPLPVDASSTLDELLAFLGRDPRWEPRP